MKTFLIILVLVLPLSFINGCAEYTAGVGTGVGIMETLVLDARSAEKDLVIGLNLLKDETTKIKEIASEVKGTVLVQPETLEAIKDTKNRTEDPITWVALASILANVFLGGRTSKKVI